MDWSIRLLCLNLGAHDDNLHNKYHGVDPGSDSIGKIVFILLYVVLCHVVEAQYGLSHRGQDENAYEEISLARTNV